MATFRGELEEHLGTLNKGLLALERVSSSEESADLLTDIFRAAHSIKGAARTVNLKDIETIAHHVEDVLVKIRKGLFSPAPQDFDSLLAAVDAIGAAMAGHLRGEGMDAEFMAAVLARLDDTAKGRPESGVPQARIDGSGGEEPPVPEPSSPALVSPASGALPATPDIATQPEPSKSSQPTGSRPIQADDTIRVRTTKLDALMEGLGELLVMQMRTETLLSHVKALQARTMQWQKKWRKARPHCNRLRRHKQKSDGKDLSPLFDFLENNEQELKGLDTEVNTLLNRLINDRNHLQLVTDDLENGIRRVRMLPISALFDLFPRMVRDLAHEQSKEIVLKVEGQETEVDRQALELMKDPLTHLLRNAIGHGIETPEQRLELGKPPSGTLRLCAEHRGSNLVLTVSDDGRGIDLETVRRSAVEQGLVPAERVAQLSEPEIIDLIFHPGVSTAAQITDLSGRGVGMDVVRKNLELVRGSIQVKTASRLGTTFTLILPLTLTTSQVLLARVAGEVLGLPMMNVERILHVKAGRVGSIEGHPAIYAEGRLLPLVSLAYILKLPEAEQSLPPDSKIPVVILSLAEKHIALRVGGFLSTQQVVVKSLGGQLRKVRNVAGAAVLGDGQLVAILNVPDLMKSIHAKSAASFALPIGIREARRCRVLLADDSITTRALEKHILENAGYDVLAVADGQEAWDLIHGNEKGLPDLVVSDINMPGMDGFALTQSIKSDSRYGHVPVVLVTSLESPQDRLHGMEAGADAYIVKSTFDQRELLETIERLIR